MTNIVDDLYILSVEFSNLVKLGIGEKRKAIEIQKLTGSIGKYIHFSDSDRSGISFNKNVHPGNPRGFYGYPLTPNKIKGIVEGNRDIFDSYGHRKYIYVFDVTGNVLNLDNFDLEAEFNKLLGYVEEGDLKYKSTLSWMRLKDLQGNRPSYKLMWFMHQIVRMLGGNEHSAMNSLYRKLGYDVILTNTGGLGDDIREQIVALTPTSINIIHKLENPLALTKEEIVEEEKYRAEMKTRSEARELQWDKEREEINQKLLAARQKEQDILSGKIKYEEAT